MTLANPNWNWDLIITLYSIAMFAGGYFICASINKTQRESALINEYRKAEELREIINGLLNEISAGIDEIHADIDAITKDVA